MGGGSLGFTGSVASFCAALLKAYCEERNTTGTQLCLFLFRSRPSSAANAYLRLNPPKLRLFGAVHLTVDDQDIGEAADVASLHLKRRKNAQFYPRMQRRCRAPPVALTVGWYFSQFSHHAWVLCSRQMLLFRISAKSYSLTFSEESRNTGDGLITGIHARFLPETRESHLGSCVRGNAW